VSGIARVDGSSGDLAERYVGGVLDSIPRYGTSDPEVRRKAIEGFTLAIQAEREGRRGKPIEDTGPVGQYLGDVICEHCCLYGKPVEMGGCGRTPEVQVKHGVATDGTISVEITRRYQAVIRENL
jgi:hypothetical protein